MINLGIYIPIEYHYAKIDYCEKQLSNLPVVRSGRHGNRNVLRIYSKDHICREVSTRSKTWDKAAAICNKREKLTATIKSIRKTLAKDYRGVTPSDFTLINTENKFDNDFYDSIKDCSCTYAKNEAYFYNGRHYRSRAEMDFAAQLDYFGLEYKYDVEFVLNGKKFSVDFLIAFREFNRCGFVEYCGMCDDPDYVERQEIKTNHARHSNLLIGRDLFIIDGDKNFTPGADVMKAFIIGIISQFCAYHIGR